MTFKLHSISYGLKAVGKTKKKYKQFMKTLKTLSKIFHGSAGKVDG